MKERRLNEVRGVILVAAGLIILASLISFSPFDLGFYTSHPNMPPKNFIRTFGAYLAGLILFLFGWSSYIIPLFILFLGIKTFRQEKQDLRIPKILGILVLLLSLSCLIGIARLRNEAIIFSRAGFLGFIIYNFITTYFGRLGGYIIFTTLLILSFALVTEILISAFFLNIGNKINAILKPLFSLNKKTKPLIFKTVKPIISERKGPVRVEQQPNTRPVLVSKPKIQIKTNDSTTFTIGAERSRSAKSPESLEPKLKPQELKIGDYHLPSLDLLDSPPPLEARQIKEDLQALSRILEDTLEDFGISVKVTDIERGPVITRYELEPAPGVKLNRIVALGDDIALAMKAQSVRVVAPIPGKARVGVEVPNTQSTFVYLREVLASTEFQESESKLTLALGKDITGQAVIADLGEMPHLLIAGTTGSGKTVCVNSLILSMLFRATPNELKFLMIDPKW